MRLKKIYIKNFKGFIEETIDFDNISLIVGKNDAGKSSILHALDLFFNPKDANKNEIFYNDTKESITLECYFDVEDLDITLGDEDRNIKLSETHLLNKDKLFVLGYQYTAESIQKSPFYTDKYIKCYSPVYIIGEKKFIFEELVQKDLDLLIKNNSIAKPTDADGRENLWKRQELAKRFPELQELTYNINKKNDRLEPVLYKLPIFKLFSNDKQNSINEKGNSKEIESEIKAIIKNQMQDQIKQINEAMLDAMKEKLEKMTKTYKDLFSFLGDDSFTMNGGTPEIKFETNGIQDKKGLSIENRGSGFRRLALLSLHLSAYKEEEYSNIIFGIEEPETSQNPHNQKGIIHAINILKEKGSQMIITTHSPSMAKEFDNVKYCIIENDGTKSQKKNFDKDDEMFKFIIETLGILPIDITGKKIVVFVEGPDEMVLFKKINESCFFDHNDILFISGGGRDLKHHILVNYLPQLKKMIVLDNPGTIIENKTNDAEISKKNSKVLDTQKWQTSCVKDLKTEQVIKLSKTDITQYIKDTVTKSDTGMTDKNHTKKIIRDILCKDKTNIDFDKHFIDGAELKDMFNQIIKYKNGE